jgi:pimeloyl-ACP methyl ester carboxylesterase
MACSCLPVTEYIEARLFQPPRPLYTYPDDVHRALLPQVCSAAYQDVGVPNICALHEGKPVRTVLYLHGNNENLPTLVEYVRLLSDTLNADVYALEYPGYSACTGDPCEAGCNAAAEKFLGHLLREARTPVVVLGFSMGCAPALFAAVKHQPAALVLLAPFVSAASVALARSEAALRWAFLWSPLDMFRTQPLAGRITCPMLVLHGEKDTIIPPAHGAALSRAAPHCDYEELAGVMHSNISTLPLALARVERWLGKGDDGAPYQALLMSKRPTS